MSKIGYEQAQKRLLDYMQLQAGMDIDSITVHKNRSLSLVVPESFSRKKLEGLVKGDTQNLARDGHSKGYHVITIGPEQQSLLLYQAIDKAIKGEDCMPKSSRYLQMEGANGAIHFVEKQGGKPKNMGADLIGKTYRNEDGNRCIVAGDPDKPNGQLRILEIGKLKFPSR